MMLISTWQAEKPSIDGPGQDDEYSVYRFQIQPGRRDANHNQSPIRKEASFQVVRLLQRSGGSARVWRLGHVRVASRLRPTEDKLQVGHEPSPHLQKAVLTPQPDWCLVGNKAMSPQ